MTTGFPVLDSILRCLDGTERELVAEVLADRSGRFPAEKVAKTLRANNFAASPSTIRTYRRSLSPEV